MADKKGSPNIELFSKEASRIARRSLKDSNQAYPLSLLAAAQAKLGTFDDAIDLANSIADPQRKNAALVMIAVHLITARNESRANAVLELLPKVPEGKIDLEAEREMAWVRIAIAQTNAGDGENALKTLEAVSDPRMGGLAKWQRAYAQARMGRLNEARALAEQIPAQFPRDERGQAFRLVAAVDAHQNGASDVMGWASHLTTAQDRTSAFLGIADGLLAEPTQEIPPYFED